MDKTHKTSVLGAHRTRTWRRSAERRDANGYSSAHGGGQSLPAALRAVVQHASVHEQRRSCTAAAARARGNEGVRDSVGPGGSAGAWHGHPSRGAPVLAVVLVADGCRGLAKPHRDHPAAELAH
eukprot:4524827-Prymnesium_polylepis.1